ncbi:hypothetical protein PR202_gb07643 [Eleusine coracana subsp. coracana]|uniref:Reverse transcriptase zinc-binding domain-containing protein n=1 Tax=Eleusine coracana subsp. coracana TaxID=191504 RepID=A0AAV5ECA3_ELECO|nr:hypothetical protein PR202_gb07643 [Eleusine coracana subsp. coracana]
MSMRGTRWSASTFVWNSIIQKKNRIFLWLMFWDRLNTNANRTKKHWTTDPFCVKCPAVASITHIILHCSLVDHVWNKLDIKQMALWSDDVFYFVGRIIPHFSHQRQATWPICFAACAQELWSAQNQRIFENSNTTVS